MKKPMVVELLGPAGAGKSTLAPLIAEQLRARGLAVEHSVQVGRWQALFREPWKTVSTLTILFATYSHLRSDSIRPRELTGTIRLGSYLLFTRAKNYMTKISILWEKVPDVYILEHGEFFFQSDQQLYSQRRSNALPLRSDVVINIEIPEAEVLARLTKRGLSKGPESRAIVNELEFRRHYLASISAAAEASQRHVPTLSVNGLLRVEESTQQICSYVENLLRSRTPYEGAA